MTCWKEELALGFLCQSFQLYQSPRHLKIFQQTVLPCVFCVGGSRIRKQKNVFMSCSKCSFAIQFVHVHSKLDSCCFFSFQSNLKPEARQTIMLQHCTRENFTVPLGNLKKRVNSVVKLMKPHGYTSIRSEESENTFFFAPQGERQTSKRDKQIDHIL